jgi:hypothetical protein
LFGGGAFLPAQGRHPFGQEGEQVVNDIRALRFGGKLISDEGQHAFQVPVRQAALVKLLGSVKECSPFLFWRREFNAADGKTD